MKLGMRIESGLAAMTGKCGGGDPQGGGGVSGDVGCWGGGLAFALGGSGGLGRGDSLASLSFGDAKLREVGRLGVDVVVRGVDGVGTAWLVDGVGGGVEVDTAAKAGGALGFLRFVRLAL